MIAWYELGFPMGRDFLVPQDKGTEVLSLSWEKGTMGRKSLHCHRTKRQQDYHWLGQNFTFYLRMGLACSVPWWDSIQKEKKTKNNLLQEKMGFFLQLLNLFCLSGIDFVPRHSGIFPPPLVPGQRDSRTGKLFNPVDRDNDGISRVPWKP